MSQTTKPDSHRYFKLTEMYRDLFFWNQLLPYKDKKVPALVFTFFIYWSTTDTQCYISFSYYLILPNLLLNIF